MSADAVSFIDDEATIKGGEDKRDLPAGWARALLGEIVAVQGEKLPPDRSSALPFIGMDDVLPNALRATSAGYFREMKSTANAVRSGDILYGRLRPYLNKVALAESSAAASAEFIVLQPRDGIDARYAQFAMHAKRCVNFATRDTSGDRPRIDFAKIYAFKIPVPPSSEQRRIVARIDELFAEIAEGEAALKRARRGLDTWRRALLKAAVTGELTREWREANRPTETGADLLARIRAEREVVSPRSAHGGRSPRIEHCRWPSHPDLPVEWVWCSVGEAGDVSLGRQRAPQHHDDPDLLPPPDEIAAEIVENLEAALDRFRKVALSLQAG